MTKTEGSKQHSLAWRATAASLLFTKNDPLDVRLGDLGKLLPTLNSIEEVQATLEELQTADRRVILLGYPDDEGISMNGGRPGAKDAPDRIRHFFYRMTPPAFLDSISSFSTFDLGNLEIDTKTIAERHELARASAFAAQKANLLTLSFGGGHDYGYPDAAAYCEAATARGERPLVINFDAHLDVRPLDRGFTSGTPFFRLLEKFPQIDFVELGLQSQCNSRNHVEWLKSRGGFISFEEQRRAHGFTLTETLSELLGDRILSQRSAFLSVDIDGFSSAVAPGASQSWPTGFDAADFFSCLSWCLGRFDVRGVGIYEVAPKLDIDDRTSRLAALIAHRFVFQL